MSQFGAFFRESISIVRRDPMVAVPYLFFFFVLNVIENQYKELFSETLSATVLTFQLVVLGWAIELIFKGITVALAHQVISDQPTDIGSSVSVSIKRLGALLVATGCFVLPFFIIFHLVQLNPESMPIPLMILSLLIILSLLPMTLVLQVIPVYIVVGGLTVRDTFSQVKIILKTKFKTVLWFSLYLINVGVLFWVISALLSQVPVVGKAVFSVGLQALGSCVSTVMGVLFYRYFTRK